MARLIATIAIVLTLPSLGGGLALDDYFHAARARGGDILPVSRFDLFNFASGSQKDFDVLVDAGFLPWFSSSDIKLAFWRPISSFTHWVDYNYFASWPWLMHAESVAWYGALVALAATLYRRVVAPAWVAGLAALLYAADDAHALPVGWVGNRNAVIAAAFGLASLVAHDRWRRDGWRLGAALGPCFLALGLLSAEGALATMAYLFSYALFLDRANLRRRAAALLPYVAVIAMWQAAYRALGYGATGSGFYLDPVREPRLYFAAAGKRAVVLLLGQFLTPPSDLSVWLTPAQTLILMAYAALILGWIFWVMGPLLARDRVARFFALGAVLALLPVCATFPSERLLLFVGIGAMGLVAQLLGALTDGASWKPSAAIWTVPARALGGAFLIAHLMVSPLLAPFISLGARIPEGMVMTAIEGLKFGPEMRTKVLVVVNTPDLMRGIYGLIVPRDASSNPPARMRILSATFGSVAVTRPDAYTISVRPRDGFLHDMSSSLVRGDQHPMHLGQIVKLTGVTAEITEMNPEGRPAEAKFRFAVPLEDPSLRWIAWDGTHYFDFSPPAEGTAATVGVD